MEKPAVISAITRTGDGDHPLAGWTKTENSVYISK